MKIPVFILDPADVEIVDIPMGMAIEPNFKPAGRIEIPDGLRITPERLVVTIDTYLLDWYTHLLEHLDMKWASTDTQIRIENSHDWHYRGRVYDRREIADQAVYFVSNREYTTICFDYEV